MLPSGDQAGESAIIPGTEATLRTAPPSMAATRISPRFRSSRGQNM